MDCRGGVKRYNTSMLRSLLLSSGQLGTVFLVLTWGLCMPPCASSDNSEAEERTYVMEPIVVKGERARDVLAEPLSESPGLELSTTIVNEAQIERQGAETVIEALEYVPGAWVETRGRKVKQFFSVRGQKYPYPEYAIDGAWQREFHETPYFFSASNIERIEVIRSSAALLKGLSGLVGIVNIIPKKYEKPETSAEMEYGTFDTYRFHLAHGASAGKVSYAVNAGSDHTDGPEGRNGAEGVTNFLGSAGWDPAENLSFKANLFHLYGKRELIRAESPPAAEQYATTSERFDPLETTLANMRAYFRPNSRASTELLLHYIDRDHNFLSEPGDPHKATREWDYEWGANLTQAISLSDSNTLRVGGLYNHWIAPNGKRFYVGNRNDLETISGVAVDEHHFGPLIADAGLRWVRTYINDYAAFNIGGSAKGLKNVTPVKDQWEPSIFNGSVGAAYYFPRILSLHLNLASGYIQPREGTLTVDLEDPENERRTKLDLGVRAARRDIGQLSVTGFLTQQDNAIVLSGKTEEMDGRIMELYLNRDQDQLGVEVEARTAPLLESIEPFLNITAMRLRAESDGEMVSNEEQPELIMSGGVYASRMGFDLNVLWKYVSSYESTRFAAGSPPSPQPLGDFHSLNATVGYSFGQKHRARVYLEIENLLDEDFSTMVGYPDLGRRFAVGLRQSFR
jgi:outer membrane cobalamin receptor